MKARTDPVQLDEATARGVTLSIRREDLLFPEVSGNKYRKLKYNLLEAKARGFNRLLTFGGAFSNHIHAVAAAGAAAGMETIGLIRGEELARAPLNPTLSDASAWGMQLHFLSRGQYARRNDPGFRESCLERFGPAYLLPEGGTNALALKGCEEILQPGDSDYDLIGCPVGTGGTLAGLSRAAGPGQRILGYSALKAPGLETELRLWGTPENWILIQDDRFGGYARIDTQLVEFINAFRERTGIPLDPVYTGKMVFGVLEDIRSGRIREGSRVLLIHTGGMQGLRGMNQKLQKKNLPLLLL
ncbi:1-aminocyclopropane-1-carboxylate deaminase/D-cysteine desulfhydrase [Robiginitalea sediminis]|uniref:1-aminocyclopropane-1-carboxylate deaminase/D-cysteine desulfhydrase n=1 Tax=Robiginitalea sediminis TaxID=1982593 RepID=UPI0018E9378D|nr:pyridoxal-phosphate dependent enzyme [Robiginitalea sediminis]